jgi:hypothetical protein
MQTEMAVKGCKRTTELLQYQPTLLMMPGREIEKEVACELDSVEDSGRSQATDSLRLAGGFFGSPCTVMGIPGRARLAACAMTLRNPCIELVLAMPWNKVRECLLFVLSMTESSHCLANRFGKPRSLSRTRDEEPPLSDFIPLPKQTLCRDSPARVANRGRPGRPITLTLHRDTREAPRGNRTRGKRTCGLPRVPNPMTVFRRVMGGQSIWCSAKVSAPPPYQPAPANPQTRHQNMKCFIYLFETMHALLAIVMMDYIDINVCVKKIIRSRCTKDYRRNYIECSDKNSFS